MYTLVYARVGVPLLLWSSGGCTPPAMVLRWVGYTLRTPRWVGYTLGHPGGYSTPCYGPQVGTVHPAMVLRWVLYTLCTPVGIVHPMHPGGYSTLPAMVPRWVLYTLLWSHGGYCTPCYTLVGNIPLVHLPTTPPWVHRPSSRSQCRQCSISRSR